jgi:ribosomal protein L30E
MGKEKALTQERKANLKVFERRGENKNIKIAKKIPKRLNEKTSELKLNQYANLSDFPIAYHLEIMAQKGAIKVQ